MNDEEKEYSGRAYLLADLHFHQYTLQRTQEHRNTVFEFVKYSRIILERKPVNYLLFNSSWHIMRISCIWFMICSRVWDLFSSDSGNDPWNRLFPLINGSHAARAQKIAIEKFAPTALFLFLELDTGSLKPGLRQTANSLAGTGFFAKTDEKNNKNSIGLGFARLANYP